MLHDPGAFRRRLLAACVLALASTGALAAAGPEPTGALPPPPPALQKALDAVRGKAVIVNFWASWCAPCRAEMPALVALDEAEPGLALITVAVADRAADSRRFLEDERLQDVVVVADPDQQIARAWQARLIPTTHLLDAGHRPRLRVVGEADWDDPALQAAARALIEPQAQGSEP